MNKTSTVFTADANAGGSPTIPRDRWGRPVITTPEGKQIAYQRATTLAGVLDDSYGLMAWKQRQTAAGIAARKDLLLRVSSLGMAPDDKGEAATWKSQMDAVCEAAMEASGSSAKATIGTALHSYTEAIDAARLEGRQFTGAVPAEYAPHLRAYADATGSLTVHAMERFLVCDELQVAGTTDRIVTMPGIDGLLIADVKTGSLAYPHKMAMQLAIYAHSVAYDPATGERTALGDINQSIGVIIGLDAETGKCGLHKIDIAAGWEAIQLALKVKEWRTKKGILEPLEATKKESIDPIMDAIHGAKDRTELIAVAGEYKPRWNESYSEACAALWEQLPA